MEPRDSTVSNQEKWEKMKDMLSENEATFIVFPLGFRVKEGKLLTNNLSK